MKILSEVIFGVEFQMTFTSFMLSEFSENFTSNVFLI
jgi:hypothetical protein